MGRDVLQGQFRFFFYSLLLALTPLCRRLALGAVDAGRSPASRARALAVLAFVAGL